MNNNLFCPLTLNPSFHFFCVCFFFGFTCHADLQKSLEELKLAANKVAELIKGAIKRDVLPISDNIEELNKLVAVVETLAEVDETTTDLIHQYEQITTLVQQFEEKIAQLSEDELKVNENAIEQMRIRLQQLQLSVETVIDKDLTGDEKEKGKRENDRLNWGELNDDNMLRCFNLIESPTQMEVNDVVEISENAAEVDMPALVRASLVEQANTVQVVQLPDSVETQPGALPQNESTANGENAVTAGNQVNNQSVQRDASKDEKMQVDTANSGNVKVSSVVTRPSPPTSEQDQEALIASLDTEFSYRSLVLLNNAIAELHTIQRMPERTMGIHFRNLREFITRFLKRCIASRIDIRFLEAILLSHVISSFNDIVFSNWKFHMLSNKASVRSVREFLAIQEEIANDEWLRDSRFVMNNAVQSMQRSMGNTFANTSSQPTANATVTSQPNNQVTNPSETSSATNTVPVAKPSYAKVVNDGARPGCSSWPDKPVTTSSPAPYCPPPAKEPGSDREKAAKAQEQKRQKKEKKPKRWECLGCGGSHPLFFCHRFLSMGLAQREQFVKDEGICPLCLIDRHSIMHCPDGTCTHCNQPHNSTLCEVSIRKKQGPKKGDDKKQK